MACRVIRKSNGELDTVLVDPTWSEKSKESELYKGLNTHYQGKFRFDTTKTKADIKEIALRTYAISETESFKAHHKDQGLKSNRFNEPYFFDIIDFAERMNLDLRFDKQIKEETDGIIEAVEAIINMQDQFTRDNVDVVAEYLNRKIPGADISVNSSGKLFINNPSNVYDVDTLDEILKGIPSLMESLRHVEGRMSNLMKKLGVNISPEDKVQYVNKKGNKEDVKARANAFLRLIETSNKNDILSLTEESIHIVLDILEASNNPLFTSMYKEIITRPIYKEIKEKYSALYEGNEYMLRKEAITHEVLQNILNGEVLGEPPTRIQRWWSKVWNFINRLFSKLGTDSYTQVAKQMLEESIEDVDNNLIKDQWYARKEEEEAKEEEDKKAGAEEEMLANRAGEHKALVERLKEDSESLQVENVPIDQIETTKKGILDEDAKGIDRYVGIPGGKFNGVVVFGRPSDEVHDQFIKKVGPQRAREINKDEYNILKREHGTAGHLTLQHISKVLTEGNLSETKKTELFKASPYSNRTHFNKLVRAVKKVHTMAEDTQKAILNKKTLTAEEKPAILIENTVINRKQTVAGSIDILVVYADNSASIFDWKFITPTRSFIEGYGRNTRISSFPFTSKMDGYNIQIGIYKDILMKDYGVTRIRHSRIVPIHVRFKYDFPNKTFGEEVTLLQEGTDSPYLEHLPVADELTNIKNIDDLIKQQIYKRNAKVSELQTAKPDQRDKLNLQIDNLTKSIQSLQVRHDISTTIEAGVDLVNDLNARIDEDSETNDDGTINIKYIPTSELLEMQERLFFLDALNSDDYMNLIKEENKTLYKKIKSLMKQYSYEFNMAKDRIQLKLDERAIEVGLKTGIKVDRLSREIGWTTRTWTNLSQIDEPAFQALAELVDRDNANTREKFKELKEEVEQKQKALIKWGGRGVSVFDKLINPETNNLWSMYSNNFWETRDSARESGDWKFFKEHYSLKEDYKEQLQYYKDLAFDSIDKRYPDKLDEKGKPVNKQQQIRRDSAKLRWLKNRDVVNHPETAWLSKSLWLIADFNEEVMEKYKTDEYKYIESVDELKDFDEMHRRRMLEFKKILGAEYGSNFIGNIHRDMLDSIFHGNMSFSSLYESMMDGLQVREHNLMYGQKNMQTGEMKKIVPKLFITGLKDSNGNYDPTLKSLDLGKNLLLMGMAAYNYRHKTESLDEALVLESMLKNNSFGEAMRAETGSLIKDLAGEYEIRRKGTPSKNLESFQKFLRYYWYGQRKQQKDVQKKIGKTTISTDRVIGTVRNYVALKYLGLAVLPGIATYIGGRVNLVYQAVKGRHLTRKGYRTASAKGIARDDVYRAFAENFEVYQANLMMRHANKLSANSATRLLTQDNFFAPYRLADEGIDRNILYSMALHHGIDENGKIQKLSKLEKGAKSLIELASITKNKNWKAGSTQNKFNLTIEGLSKDEHRRFRKMVRRVGHLVKGSMSDEDISLINTSTYGQALMQFKNWMPGTMQARFGKMKFDTILDSFEEGSWRSFSKDQVILEGELQSFTMLLAQNVIRLGLDVATFGLAGYKVNETKARVQFEEYATEMAKLGDEKFINSLKNEALREELFEDFMDMKKGNIKAFAAELRTVILFLMSISFLGGDFDDDDKADYRKAWLGRKLYYLLNRTYLEVGYYADMGEMQKVLTTPVPLFRLGVDIYSLVRNTNDELRDWAVGENAPNDPTPFLYYGSDFLPGFNQAGSLFEVFEQDKNKSR